MTSAATHPRAESRPDYGLPLDTPPMDARTADSIPQDDGRWQYEPKWDGFRCLAFKADGRAELRAKSGKPLARYFPEVEAMLQGIAATRFVADGELVVETGGLISFDALQARLHPAESRIRKLAAETPARLVLFDLLVATDGRDLMPAALAERRGALEHFLSGCAVPGKLVLSPASRERRVAEAWLREAGQGALDGIVAKRLDSIYEPGERGWIKIKPRRTADCVVGGFRYQTGGNQVGSLLLGLYDAEGRLDHVGFTTTITATERPALTRGLEALIEPPGFTGDAPGGPSRWRTERSAAWQPLRPELVVEVEYDQLTGGRFRHGTRLMRWRPDKAPRQCTFDQLGTYAR